MLQGRYIRPRRAVNRGVGLLLATVGLLGVNVAAARSAAGMASPSSAAAQAPTGPAMSTVPIRMAPRITGEPTQTRRAMPAAPAGTVTLNDGRVELPLDLATRRPMIQLTVDGQGPYWFVVDTGAGGNVIDNRLAEKLELTSVGVQMVGSPGGAAVEAHRFAVDELAAGGLRIADTEAVGVDLAALAGGTFQGIVGMRNFVDYLITLDYPDGTLVIEPGGLSGGDDGTVPFALDGRLIRFDIDVAGVTVPADLDSGSAHSFTLPKAFEGRWSFLTPVTEVGKVRMVGGEHILWGARLDGTITVAGLTFEDPEVGLAEFTTDFANIGYDVLRRLAVTIDQRNGLVRLQRVTPAGGTRP